MIYLYIHGFGGSGLGVKSRLFRSYFGAEIVAPSLSYVPELAVDTLEQLIERLLRTDSVTLIGSSLGGYYAIYCAEKYGLKAVLINPSIRPYETLERVIDDAFCYYDLSRFEWNPRHIEMLGSFETAVVHPERYLVLLQKGDELLDYRQAERKFEGACLVIEEEGDHSYQNIESKFDLIHLFANGEVFH